jgi:uncharacterized protein YjbI with pentapeptide repeats
MGKCCTVNCENECFEQEDKCIMHCKKSILIDYLEKNINDESTLVLKKIDFPKNFNYQIIFDKSKAIEFWNCTFNDIENKINILNHRRIHFYECKFNKHWIHINIDGIVYSNCDFYDEIFFERDLNNGENKIYTVVMHDCNVYKKFDLDFDAINLEQCNIKMLHLDNSVFHEKVKIKNCKIENHSFINTRFKSLADFHKTEFYSNFFFKTTFEDIVVFTESKFHENVNFKYTTFEKLALFRKTIFEKTVNFEDAIIKEEANFLEITSKKDKIEAIDVKNRETARIIKNSFEQQNNIIEANRFYALEMEKREKELDKNIKKGENIIEWLIFKIHSISSDHSQSAYLAFLWIFNLSYLYIIYCSTSNVIDNIIAFSAIAIILVSMIDMKNALKIGLTISLLEFQVFSNVKLDVIADKINPFSIMNSWDEIPFKLLIFKVIIAYLIYQFIISVRQNTRRK